MNHIELKSTITCYDYPEYYCIIDGKPITVYLDEFVRNNSLHSLSGFGSLRGLMPAWCGKLLWQWENDFVWEMVDSPEELNVPILVCEDDCDLSCIVIMVHIRKEKDRNIKNNVVECKGTMCSKVPFIICICYNLLTNQRLQCSSREAQFNAQI